MINKNVKQNLLKVNLKAGNYGLAVKLALQLSAEGGGFVYLENAFSLVESKISRREFAGYLSALAKEGFYKQQDQHFGLIEN